MRGMIIRSLLAVLAVWCAVPAFTVDASMNFNIADKYYHRFASEASAARFQYDAGLSQDFLSVLNATAVLWSSHRLNFQNGGFTLPEELDYQGFLSYDSESFMVSLNGNVYTLAQTTCELGLLFDYYVPMGLEFLEITLGAAAYWDFRGFYEEVRVEPSLSLPLGKGLSLSLPLTLGFAENGFNNLTFDGLTGLLMNPKITYLLADEMSIRLSGGYFLTFNAGTASYWFISAGVGFRFSPKE